MTKEEISKENIKDVNGGGGMNFKKSVTCPYCHDTDIVSVLDKKHRCRKCGKEYKC